MKKFRFAVLTVVGFLMVLTITTCKKTVALGSTVDVLPPSSSVTRDSSASDSVAKAGSFTIEGVAGDDSGVASVTVVFENRETKERLPAMSATLAQPGAPKTAWKLVIDNEWKGEYVDERELVKKYPIRDSEYNVIITITDRNNKSTQQTLVYTIDNTPPVVIIDRPALIAESANWTNARSSTYGSILRISGQAQDTSRVQEIEFKAYDSENPTGDSYSITKNLGGAVSISQEIAAYDVDDTTGFPKAGSDYTKLLNLQGCDTQQKITGTSEIFTRNILADYYVKDSVIKNGQTTGNVNEFYYARDTISELFNGEANGYKKNYDAKTIYNYLSNRQPWDEKVPESELLKAFREDTNAQELLKNARIMCGTDAATATKKSVLTLDPNKDPGYFVSSLKVINNDTVSEIVSMNMGVPLTINLMKNMNEVPIVVSPLTVEKLEATKLRVFLVSEPTGGIEKLIENMQKLSMTYDGTASGNKIGDPGSESEVIKIYDINEHTGAGDTTFIETNGNYVVKVKLPNGAAGKYGLVLVGQDSKSNEFFPRDENGNRISGGSKQIILNLIASGAPPTIIANDLNKYYKKDTSFEYTFTVERAGEVKYSIKKTGGSEIVNATPITPSSGTADYKIELDLSAAPWNNVPDGKYSITINAKNSAGNCNPRSVDFYLDNTQPTVELQTPTATEFGQWINDFTVKAKDNLALDAVYYQVDNGAEMPFGKTATEGEYKATISMTKSPTTLKIWALDKAGNKSAPLSKNYTVNTKSPLITVELPDASTGALHPVSESSTYVAKSALNNFEVKVKASPQLSGAAISKISIALSGYDGTITAPSSEKANPVNGEYTATFNLKEENFNKGNIKVTVRAYDDSTPANAGIVDKFIQIDNTAPDFTVSTSTTYFTGPTAEFKGKVIENESGLDEASLQFELFKKSDSGAWDNKTPASPNNKIKVTGADWTISLDGLSEQGEYKWTATVKDKAGNAATLKTVEFAIDKDSPKLEHLYFAKPNAGGAIDADTKTEVSPSYSTGDFFLSGEATDTNSIKTVEIFQNGTKLETIRVNKKSQTIEKKISALTNGTYEYTVTVTDVAGKLSQKTITVIVDKNAPTLTILTVAQNGKAIAREDWITNGVLEISGDVSDRETAIASLKASLDGTTWTPIGFSAGKFKGSVPVQASTTGLSLKATDMAGNETEANFALKYDNTAPTLTVSPTSGNINTSVNQVTVTFTGTDADSGIAGYAYKKEGDADFTETTFTSIDFTSDVDVTYVVRAIDKVGLFSSEARVKLTVDKTVPTVSFAANLGDKPLNKKVDISGTATDNKGLAKVELRIKSGQKKDGSSAVGTLATKENTDAYNWKIADFDTELYKDKANLVLEAIATDIAGNSSVASEITLYMDQDSDRPEIVVQGPTALTNGTLNSNSVTGSITDDDGVKKLYISQNDTDWGSPVTLTNGINWSYNGLADGDRTLYFKVVDGAGTTFMSSTTADQLTLPKTYLSDKTSTPIGAPATFMVDTKKPDIMEVKTTVDSQTAGLMQNALFKVDRVILTVVAKDTNGIQSVVAKLAGQSDVTLTGQTGNTANSNETFTGELALGDHGVKELEIEVTDNAGAKQTQSYILRVDKQGPTPLILYPKNSDAVAGTISISGSISDDSQVSSGVNKDETKYFFANNNDIPIESSAWKNMKTSTVANFSFDYSFPNYVYNEGDLTTHDDDVLTIDGVEVPADWKVPNTDRYKLPLWIRSKDMAGNVSITKFTILYNAVAEKPVLTIVSPASEAKVGGTFTIFGTAKVDIGTLSDVGEGYIQFSKSATFDSNNCNINGVDFWKSGNGVSLTSISNGSWNYIANEDTKLDPKGASQSWNLYVRVRGKNTAKHRLGDWTDPIQITVDKDTPTINSAKVQKGADPAQNYTSNMWVSDGCVLTADLQDASGLKEIKVMFGYYKNKEEVNGNGNNEFIFKKGEPTPSWLIENGSVATGGKNYKLQLPMDLTKLVPDAQTNQTFKVNVFIQEDTNQNLNNSMEFVFRFDQKKPNGAFGEKIESGNASFDTGSVTNTRLAEAVGNFTGTSTKLILVDNVIVTPKSRTGDTVTFNETITGGTHNYIVYEPKAIIKGSFQAHGVANDDGSGVKSVKVVVHDRNGGTSAEVESSSSGANRFTREYGNQVVWNADINVSGLADGQGKVICTITDDAGNTKTSKTPVFISNNPITPTKLTFGTDLDANGTVDSNEVEKEQMSITRDGTVSERETLYRGSVNFGTWTFKNVKSNFAVEFTGGNTDLQYTLSVDNAGTLTDLTNHTNKTIASKGIIDLIQADFDQIGDGTGKKLVLKLSDDSGWTATVNITVNVQIADTDAPKSAILPFYWNSKTDNSLVHMDVNRNTSINLGHIEFDGYDTGSGTYTNKPAISGTVIVKGTAYDEKLLNSLTFNFAGLIATLKYPNDSSSPWTVASGASAGLTVKVESKRLDQSGHYIVWEVMFESEKIANVVNADTTLSIVANDKGSNASSSQGSTSSIISGIGTRKTNIKLQLQDGTDFSQIKPGMRVRMYNPNQKRQAYYASIASVDPDAKTIDVDSAVDDAEVKAYEIYKNDHNSYTMNVSIVPYISQVITPTSEEGDANNLTRYGRTAQGDYTVLKDANNQTEKIKVIGFNLTGAKYGGTAINTTVDVVRNITVARQSDSYAQNFIAGGTYTQKALQFVPTNGALELSVGSLKTINNSNKTDGDGFSGDVALWNNEGDNYAHKNVGDNRSIVVLSANELVKRTMITAPSFAVLNNQLGYAYSRITEFFMTKKSDNNVEKFGQNPGSYLGTAFAYDQWGNTFGISGNNDVTMGGNGAITQVSSYYLHWNAPGTVAGKQDYWGAGGYYYRTQANRIMALTPVIDINNSDALTQMRRARMQQPVLQTHGEYVYLAYYDMATQKLELRVDKPKRNGSDVVLVNGLGSRSTSFTTFAGSLTERNKTDSQGATGGQTAGAMVFATTAGGGLATGLTITDAYVVVAYKTANGLELAYAPITDVEVPLANQNVDKFTKITVDADSSTGAYVRATSSGNVVHLAYYDSTSGGRLKYAKIDLGSTDKTPQVAVVDNVKGNTGYYTSITVNADGKPFIAYAMKDYVDSASKMALKLAYPIEIGDVKNGSDETEQCYTGDWEIMNLRASYGLQGSNYDCPPQITAFYYNNDICVGYATMENLEYVKVPVKY
ncbi:MAG: Ig-like domain-containing protein [Treponemataceae bacterium]